MKKFILFCVPLLAISWGGLASAQSSVGEPSVPQAEASHSSSATPSYPPSVIDGIAVPFEVDMYVQTEYQGHAITAASKSNHGGKEAYRLHVDRDDIVGDYSGFYLFYGMDWKLVTKTDVAPPPPSPPSIDEKLKELERKAEEEARRRAEEAERQAEEAVERAERLLRRQEGGRGGGGNRGEDENPEPTPAPTPQQPGPGSDDDEDEGRGGGNGGGRGNDGDDD